MQIFGTNQRKKGKLYAQKRLLQAQQSRFSDGSADYVSYVDKTEREIRAELRHNFLAKIRKIISILLVVIGILAMCYSAYNLIDVYRDYSPCTEITEGNVVDLYDPERFNINSLVTKEKVMLPVVEYEVGEETYHLNGNTVIGSAPYTTGIHVNVKYNPDKPEQAFFTTEFDTYIMYSLINFAVCLFMFILSAILMQIRETEQDEECERRFCENLY